VLATVLMLALLGGGLALWRLSPSASTSTLVGSGSSAGPRHSPARLSLMRRRFNSPGTVACEVTSVDGGSTDDCGTRASSAPSATPPDMGQAQS